MDLERLSCGSCGASLDVPAGVQYVNCRHCGSSLKVQRTESVAFTEVQQTLQEHSDRLEVNTEILRLQGQLAQLDRDWDQRSASLMDHGKDGSASVPSKVSAVFTGIFMSGLGLLAIIMAAGSNGGAAPAAWLGVLLIFIAITMSIGAYSKAETYETLQSEYDRNRSQLMARLRMLGM